MKVLRKIWKVVDKHFLSNTAIGFIIALLYIGLMAVYILVPEIKGSTAIYIIGPIIVPLYIWEHTEYLIRSKGK